MKHHRNQVTGYYRYKTYNEKNEKFVKIEHFAADLSFCSKIIINGIPFIRIKYDYKPYLFFKYLWSFINWYKRPMLKNIRTYPIISIVLKFIFKFMYAIIVSLIGGILLIMYSNEIKNLLNY